MCCGGEGDASKTTKVRAKHWLDLLDIPEKYHENITHGIQITELTYRILHEWLFHMKFMKRDFGEFYEYNMK